MTWSIEYAYGGYSSGDYRIARVGSLIKLYRVNRLNGLSLSKELLATFPRYGKVVGGVTVDYVKKFAQDHMVGNH